jgi:hypothetical protein
MPDAGVGRVDGAHRFDVAAFNGSEKAFREVESGVGFGAHGTRR